GSQTVLDGGRAEEASRLAGQALLQYGATEAAERFILLRRQADALLAAQAEGQAARRQRLLDEAAAAARDSNLRAAAFAYEQALAFGDDADLRGKCEQVRVSLKRYDDA